MTFKGAADGAEKIKERRVRGSQEKHQDPIFLLSGCPVKSPPPGAKCPVDFHPPCSELPRQYMSFKKPVLSNKRTRRSGEEAGGSAQGLFWEAAWTYW